MVLTIGLPEILGVLLGDKKDSLELKEEEII
jgi:hypothetical protein